MCVGVRIVLGSEYCSGFNKLLQHAPFLICPLKNYAYDLSGKCGYILKSYSALYIFSMHNFTVKTFPHTKTESCQVSLRNLSDILKCYNTLNTVCPTYLKTGTYVSPFLRTRDRIYILM